MRVRSDAGRRYGIYLDSTLPGIEPGDRVTFKYVEETGGAHEFRVLGGRAVGTIVRDDDEDIYPYFWLFGGVVFSGVLAKRSNKEATAAAVRKLMAGGACFASEDRG